MPAASQRSLTDRRPPAGSVADEMALAFLSEILAGERAWTTVEVQRLISMREAAQAGRWRETGLDDEAAISG